MSAARFVLRGDRAVTHRVLAELTTRTGHAIAWARPGAEPLVVLTAAEFARLAGRVDFPALAAWCGGLRGRVIVCEQQGATWLPFVPLATVKSTRGTSAEAVFLGLGP